MCIGKLDRTGETHPRWAGRSPKMQCFMKTFITRFGESQQGGKKLMWEEHCRRCLQHKRRQRRPAHNGRSVPRSSHPFLHLYTKIHNSGSHGRREFKFGRSTGIMEAKLMVGGRTRLRPQWAGFGRKFITHVPVDLESSNLVGVQTPRRGNLW